MIPAELQEAAARVGAQVRTCPGLDDGYWAELVPAGASAPALAWAAGESEQGALDALHAKLCPTDALAGAACALCGGPAVGRTDAATVVYERWPRHARRVLSRNAPLCAICAGAVLSPEADG